MVRHQPGRDHLITRAPRHVQFGAVVGRQDALNGPTRRTTPLRLPAGVGDRVARPPQIRDEGRRPGVGGARVRRHAELLHEQVHQPVIAVVEWAGGGPVGGLVVVAWTDARRCQRQQFVGRQRFGTGRPR
jgi:hypothetical protein